MCQPSLVRRELLQRIRLRGPDGDDAPSEQVPECREEHRVCLEVREGAALLHQVDPGTLIRPAVVIDISEAGAADADCVLTPDQVAAFEAANGRIATGSVVLLRTGWEAFNTDPVRYGAGSGRLRFPGFGPDATRVRVEERGVVGLGIDTMSIDPGNSDDFVVHRTVSLSRGLWHLEGLQNLAALPPVGAWVFVGVLNLVDGSGSPARVLALVP